MNRILQYSFFTAWALSISSLPAWAYVPPSAFIVKGIAGKHAGIKGLRIKTLVTAMEGEKLSSTRVRTVTHFNPQTGVIHAYALDENNQKLFAVERRNETATGADALLFWSSPRNLALALKARGVPVKTEEELGSIEDADERRGIENTGLGRWNSKIAWIIGAKKSESQLWVEKDNFLPLRLIAPPSVASGGDESLVELEFEGQRTFREFPFPRAIVVRRNKDTLLRDEVQDVALTLDVAEFRGTFTPGFTELGKSASSGVKDLIQRYFEMVR